MRHRHLPILLGCIVSLTVGCFSLARWSGLSGADARHTLAASFNRDLDQVVYAWNPDDARPLPQRRRALFEFVYESYNSSLWLPHGLLRPNFLARLLIGDPDTIAQQRLGLALWSDNELVPAFGMAPNSGPDQPLGWTANCLVCHSAEIDGVVYLGAGSKVFDEHVLSAGLKKLTASTRLSGLPPGSREEQMAQHTNQVLHKHHHDKIIALTRARSSAFAASHVELYMRAHDYAMPPSRGVGRGDVKTPPLWHVAAKQPTRRWYSDGSFHGEFPLMASSMELEKDRSFDELIQHVLPRIEEQFDTVVRHLRPPPYPYAIDAELVEQGRRLFYSEAMGCYACHGFYDGQGGVDWPGVHADMGTDPLRLAVVDADFIRVFDASPLKGKGQLEKSEGYAATPLTGVWANYPYLHNGSVPTLYHLLGPSRERPPIFHVQAARHFDPKRVGQQLFVEEKDGRRTADDLEKRYGANRDWFSNKREGCDNGGHDLWELIATEENRLALIEYLKTL